MSSIKPPGSPARIAYLDGLRGIAALYVVFAHALGINWPDSLASARWTDIGPVALVADVLGTASRYAVVLFIVLSGTSLMLPVVRGGGVIAGGFRDYARRRIRRIVPPYYGALALSLALIALVPGMGDETIDWWTGALPAFEADVLLSHLLLVHNWSPDLAYRINPPLWTIPIEWQIYFLFPLLLLPVWRRLGNAGAVAVAMVVAMAVYLAVGPASLVQSAPWFLALFALGMLAADRGYGPRAPVLPVGWIATLLVVPFLAAAGASFAFGLPFEAVGWIPDLLFGAMSAALIVWCARTSAAGARPPLLVRLLGSRTASGLGWFSYSLYLVHAPVLVLVALGLAALTASPVGYLLAVFTGSAAAVAVAWVFHVVLERPFLSRRPSAARAGQTRTRTAVPGMVSRSLEEDSDDGRVALT